MAERDKHTNQLIINYTTLRTAIGSIAFLLPAVLLVGNFVVSSPLLVCKGVPTASWPQSLSGYYFTPMRNVLVGSVCAIAVFLIAYNGYNMLDTFFTDAAGVFALGVAFCPTSNPCFQPAYVGTLHHFFAAALLIFFALMALQFTRTARGKDQPLRGQFRHVWKALLFQVPPTAEDATEAKRELAELEAKRDLTLEQAKQKWELQTQIRKRRRNQIYSTCAWLIIVWLILSVLQTLIHKNWHLFFFCEVGALWTFGVSWFVKGQALVLRDPKEPSLSRAEQVAPGHH